MANPSLSEYLAQSQRGMYQSVFGPDFVSKAAFGGGNIFSVDTATGIFDATYGRKVWQALNNQTRFFNAIPRTVWGNTAGWRIRTDRGASRSTPVTEAGNLPTVDISNIETIQSLPRIVGTTFGASVKSVFTSQLEGGVGDVLALENENAQLDHVKEINEELLAGSAYRASAGAAGAFTVPAAVGKHFKKGDKVSFLDITANGTVYDDAVTVSRVVDTVADGVVTFDANFAQPTDAGDIISIYSRAGLTSIADIVAVKDMDIGGAYAATSSPDKGARPRAYNLSVTGRAAGAWDAAATVLTNGGTARDLSLTHLDQCIQAIRENGGEPKLILLGHDQYFNMERILVANQRYMGQEEYQVGVGSERTFPGTRTGLVLATYQGIPILPDADVSKSVDSAGVVQGSDIYVLDTDYLEIAVAQPTQYVENRDYFAANALVVRGLLYTMAELRCKNMFVQAKITDLKAVGS